MRSFSLLGDGLRRQRSGTEDLRDERVDAAARHVRADEETRPMVRPSLR